MTLLLAQKVFAHEAGQVEDMYDKFRVWLRIAPLVDKSENADLQEFTTQVERKVFSNA